MSAYDLLGLPRTSQDLPGPPRRAVRAVEAIKDQNPKQIKPNPTKIKPNRIEIKSKSNPNRSRIKIEAKSKSKSNRNPRQILIKEGNPRKSQLKSWKSMIRQDLRSSAPRSAPRAKETGCGLRPAPPGVPGLGAVHSVVWCGVLGTVRTTKEVLGRPRLYFSIRISQDF